LSIHLEFPGEMEFHGIVMKFEFYMKKYLGNQNGTTIKVNPTTMDNCITMLSHQKLTLPHKKLV
jgi:hypothetical protein